MCHVMYHRYMTMYYSYNYVYGVAGINLSDFVFQ